MTGFKDFCKHFEIKQSDGTSVPFVMNKQQERFADFIQWCDENSKRFMISDFRSNKALFANLWTMYNKERNK